jgi:hypothetical protein
MNADKKAKFEDLILRLIGVYLRSSAAQMGFL